MRMTEQNSDKTSKEYKAPMRFWIFARGLKVCELKKWHSRRHPWFCYSRQKHSFTYWIFNHPHKHICS